LLTEVLARQGEQIPCSSQNRVPGASFYALVFARVHYFRVGSLIQWMLRINNTLR
jgi:hypothetical protein